MEEGFTIVDQSHQWKKVLPCGPVPPMEEGFTIVDQSHQWKKILPL